MRFRLLVDGARDGATNMAVDESLLESAMRPGALPALRLYHFAKPTVTFGYGQDVADAVDEAACRRTHIEWTRRITGGRALLHQNELTYSVAAPRFAGSVRSAYGSVMGALRNALTELGVPLDPPGERPAPIAASHLPCLSVATGHEIGARGKKLVASAMRFRRHGFLVHGSILWSVDRALWTEVTRLTPDDPLPAIGLRDLETPGFSEVELVEALSSSFESLWGGPPIVAPLTPEESGRTSVLRAKYRSESWNVSRQEASIAVG